MRKVMLTTVDNPYDPFDQWDLWFAFDLASGYNSTGMLARIAVVSDELSEADYYVAVEDAVDEILEINVTGMYRKLVKEVPPAETV